MEVLTEVFIPVQGYPNYEISQYGNIRREKDKKVIKPQIKHDGYLAVRISRSGEKKEYKIHRLVAIHFIPNINNCPIVDHINLNKFDNRVQNLRWCNETESAHNTSSHKNSSSIYKGVSYDKSKKKWHARIRKDGKDEHLGYYMNEIDAANVYNTKAKEYYGDFAKLNDINE